MPTIVLVHGAFHGAWCFDLLLPHLDARGVDPLTVELPLTGLDEDAGAVVAALDAVTGPVTLLGHSYGGAVVTAAGLHPSVERLVYLAAMAPDDGQPASGGPVEIGADFLSAFRVNADGLPEIDPSRAPALFYPDLEPERARAFAAKLRPGMAGGADLVGRAAWHDRPTHYVVCEEDPILLAASQRAIGDRLGATMHALPGDHSPFLARPEELATVLARVLDDDETRT